MPLMLFRDDRIVRKNLVSASHLVTRTFAYGKSEPHGGPNQAAAGRSEAPDPTVAETPRTR
jgi:hypothetical protein